MLGFPNILAELELLKIIVCCSMSFWMIKISNIMTGMAVVVIFQVSQNCKLVTGITRPFQLESSSLFSKDFITTNKL